MCTVGRKAGLSVFALFWAGKALSAVVVAAEPCCTTIFQVYAEVWNGLLLHSLHCSWFNHEVLLFTLLSRSQSRPPSAEVAGALAVYCSPGTVHWCWPWDTIPSRA